MKKTAPTGTPQASDDQSPQNEAVTAPTASQAPPAADEPVLVPLTAPIDDDPAPAVDEVALPNPSAGGCYVRLENGQLKREDD